jgi:hypothetical protein
MPKRRNPIYRVRWQNGQPSYKKMTHTLLDRRTWQYPNLLLYCFLKDVLKCLRCGKIIRTPRGTTRVWHEHRSGTNLKGIRPRRYQNRNAYYEWPSLRRLYPWSATPARVNGYTTSQCSTGALPPAVCIADTLAFCINTSIIKVFAAFVKRRNGRKKHMPKDIWHEFRLLVFYSLARGL